MKLLIFLLISSSLFADIKINKDYTNVNQKYSYEYSDNKSEKVILNVDYFANGYYLAIDNEDKYSKMVDSGYLKNSSIAKNRIPFTQKSFTQALGFYGDRYCFKAYWDRELCIRKRDEEKNIDEITILFERGNATNNVNIADAGLKIVLKENTLKFSRTYEIEDLLDDFMKVKETRTYVNEYAQANSPYEQFLFFDVYDKNPQPLHNYMTKEPVLWSTQEYESIPAVYLTLNKNYVSGQITYQTEAFLVDLSLEDDIWEQFGNLTAFSAGKLEQLRQEEEWNKLVAEQRKYLDKLIVRCIDIYQFTEADPIFKCVEREAFNEQQIAMQQEQIDLLKKQNKMLASQAKQAQTTNSAWIGAFIGAISSSIVNNSLTNQKYQTKINNLQNQINTNTLRQNRDTFNNNLNWE